ncbi:hypothetical protein DXG03_008794 [Asterophora parasitica]|uniref:BTB domain-containing protein n=1 Tax=Asterophora parasitica TaxID=117018 RepID=A0A9P7G6S8_9AGAR|nr:hypothetical protein DXG03_008794 [Asterophora parasitica]
MALDLEPSRSFGDIKMELEENAIPHISDTAAESLKRPLDPPPDNFDKKRARNQWSDIPKHPSHWQRNGDIEIVLQNTRFRIQANTLVKSSTKLVEYAPSLKGMMSSDVEDDEDYHPEVKDLPLQVDLESTGLLAKDFAELLDAFDNPFQYLHTESSFDLFSAILRASTILGVTSWREWAVKKFEKMWPASLDHVTAERIPLAIESIAVSRKCDVPTVLKRAFYELARTPSGADDILTKLPASSGGQVLSSSDHLSLLITRNWLVDQWVYLASRPLSPGTQTRLFKEDAKSKNDKITRRRPKNCSCRCKSNSAVIPVSPVPATLHAELVMNSGVYSKHMHDPIYGLKVLMDTPWESGHLCEACVRVTWVDGWRKERERLWAELEQHLPSV